MLLQLNCATGLLVCCQQQCFLFTVVNSQVNTHLNFQKGPQESSFDTLF